MKTKKDIKSDFSGKTLNERINEVMSKGSMTSKRYELIKLGLTAGDINYIFSKYDAQIKKSQFDFSKLTFGVEIECYHCDRYSLIEQANSKGLTVQSESYNHNDNKAHFKIVSDASLVGEDSNEVVSPILKGNKGLSSLKKLCKALENVGARVNRSCGLHVHIGAENMSDSHYCRLVRNYQKLEGVIDSFMPESRRGNNNTFAKSLSRLNFSHCSSKQDIFSVTGDRYYKVNMAPAYMRHKTIEFRQHSGTTDYEKISNWILFLAKLVEYSYENEITECVMIEDIPFLTEDDKIYFTNRRNQLEAAL